jgi:hypothetical protein
MRSKERERCNHCLRLFPFPGKSYNIRAAKREASSRLDFQRIGTPDRQYVKLPSSIYSVMVQLERQDGVPSS